MKRILAFSSSRVDGGAYLEAVAPVLHQFLGDAALTIAFVPFASVEGYEDYHANVTKGLSALPYRIRLVTEENAREVIEEADAVMVGGGNTFKLLSDLYRFDLVDLIRQRVEAGTPYIGWSAGSNLCGPGLYTTNDMPIVQPQSFEAFGFFPFQINPHYRNEVNEHFHGETRDQRLEEFLKLNPGRRIMALPEGTWLLNQQGRTWFDGAVQGVRMSREEGLTVHEMVNPGTEVRM